MRYIANIVTKSDKYKFNDFIKICRDKHDLLPQIPTLVVGIEQINEFLDEKPDYLFRQVDENTFWTFSTMENRSKNEEDVEKFKKLIVKELKKKVKYTFLNVLTFSLSRFKTFLTLLNESKHFCYYVTEKMLYIAFDDIVWGIAFDDCEYIGIKKEKIIKKIHKITNNITSERRFLSEDDKLFFQNDDILLAAMFSYARS